MSVMRTRYAIRLVGRVIVLVIGVLMCIYDPGPFDVLQGDNFFRSFSWLHLLWIVWVIDMAAQIFPLKAQISLGGQKLWKMRFQPLKEKFSVEALKKHIVSTTRAAYKVMMVWILLISAIGHLHYRNILSDVALFMTTVIFYVCDLICVLIWCPFRLMMGNRCCTTCRIFNWDHLMMFSPLLFFPSVYCWSLLALAIASWLVWEIFIFLHPERFWEGANAALTCASCTDKLCTQYCRKLRPPRTHDHGGIPMSPLTPRLIICGFFGLFNGLLSYILLPDIPDAPRWSLISGLTTFGVLLLIMTIREDSRIRRYTRAEKLLPTAPSFTMGASFRQGRKAASVNVYLCGSEIILIDVSGREPVLTRLPRHELRSLTFVPPVELRLKKYDGSRLLLLSPYMEAFIRQLHTDKWPVDAPPS